MDLSDHDIDEFRSLWRAAFGDELSLDAARAEALRLLELYFAIAGFPPPTPPLPNPAPHTHEP